MGWNLFTGEQSRSTRAIFVVLMVLALAGCGGGEVKIQERNYDNLRIQPHLLIQKLEAAHTTEDQVHILNGLRRDDAYRFDWPMFWEALAQKPIGKTLYANHSQNLDELALLHCDSFSEYTRFLLTIEGDIQTVVSPNRLCATPLTPDVAMEVTVRLMQTGDPASANQALVFLTKEATAPGRQDHWLREFEAAAPAMEVLTNKFLSSSTPEIYFDSMAAIGRKLNQSAYPASFLAVLTTNKPALQKWFAHYSGLSAVQTLATLAAETPSFSPTPDGLSNLVEGLEANLAATPAEMVPTTASDSIRFLLPMVEKTPLKTQLATLDRLLAQTEKSLAGLDSSVREKALEEWISYRRHEPHYIFLQWTALRFDPKGTRFAEGIRQTLASVQPGQSTLFRLMDPMVRAFAAANVDDRAAWISKACDSMALPEAALPVEILSSNADLQTGLEKGLEAGCYTLPNGSAAEVNSSLPLSASFASVLRGQNQELRVKAPSLRLGLVHLQRTTRADRLATTPTAPHANALSFPILFGARLKTDSTFFRKGTHFFTFHYTYRNAADGMSEPQSPAAGQPGAAMIVQTAEPILEFPFASQGELGQPGALPRPGGLGDISFVDFTNLSAWVTALVDEASLAVLLPAKVEEALSLENVEDLLANATRNTAGEVELFTVPGYLAKLPPAQYTKIVLACRETTGNNAITAAQVSQCFQNIMARKGITQLEQLLAVSAADGSIDRTSVHPVLNPKVDFKLSAGNIGPANPHGATGNPGEIKIQSFN